MSAGRDDGRGRRLFSGVRPGLDERSYSMRHRLALVVLWSHVPLLAAVGLTFDMPVVEVLAASVVLVLLAMSGTFANGRTTASNLVTIGLITAAGTLVYFTGGLAVAQFDFLLMITVISFYNDWRLLALGVVYVTAYELSVDLAPSAGPGSGMAIDAVWWSVIYSMAVLFLALILMAGWRINSRTGIIEGAVGEQFRLAFAVAPAGMALLRPSGEFVEVNEAFAALLGYDSGHFVDLNIRAIVHRDDLSELGKAWEEMGNGDAHKAEGWMRCLTSSGRTLWASLSLALVPWAPDRPAMVVLGMEDAGRAHHAEKRLEELIAGKDEFVAAIGDELRVPIGSLIDLTSLETEAGDPTMRRIGAHAREISSVVDDLVVSARFDAGAVSVIPRFIDSAALCREVLSDLTEPAAVTAEVRPLSAWADPKLARQIVSGLVNNALRYGGSKVVLRTVTSGPDTVIQVIDDGPEIPGNERDRIFASDLHNGRPGTSPASVGLGLTVGRRLARKMDGDIVYRRTQDHRNVFELRLPSDQLTRIGRPLAYHEEDRLGVSA
jgi:PAS domain S-box-containing protein